MEIAYKKDGNNNYMIIKKHEVYENDYKFQMVINNTIPGILPLKIKNINNEQELFYNTTSMLSLENMFAKEKMCCKELFELVKEIKNLFDNLKEYLLDFGCVLFDVDKIYIKRQTNKYMFCYCPQIVGNVQDSLRNLFDRLLEYIDYEDRVAVLIAYEIQRLTINDDFTVQDLFECAEKNFERISKEEKEVAINDVSINKVVVESEAGNKRNFIKKLGQIFKTKNKFKSEKELDNDNLYTENFYEYACVSEDIAGYDTDEATMLLPGREAIASITLRSMNLEDSLVITPKIFPCVIGTSKNTSDYIVNNPVISRVHMRIIEETTGYFVEDLNSTNGTYVNDVKLVPHLPKEIMIGDKIMLANIEFIVE